MVNGDLRKEKKLVIEGNVNEVRKECMIIMRELYDKNVELHGKDQALAFMTRMFMDAVGSDVSVIEGTVEWRVSDEEMLGYTD